MSFSRTILPILSLESPEIKRSMTLRLIALCYSTGCSMSCLVTALFGGYPVTEVLPKLLGMHDPRMTNFVQEYSRCHAV